MPVQYEGVLSEHDAVRQGVGLFDVSHLGRFEVIGSGATELLRSQLCNDIERIGPGRAQYTMALNSRGGIEDDIIVWQLDDDRFWVMPNGTNFDGIISRFRAAAPEDVEISDVRAHTVLLAVQGPDAPGVIETVLGVAPGRFRVLTANFDGHEVICAGTGYTGERGGELCVSSAVAPALWRALVQAGATPAGLGSRDTLRLEMGYPLWGQDLGPDTTPLEAGLGWVVAWDHDFIGRDALRDQRDSLARQMISFTTKGRAIPRQGYVVNVGSSDGVVSSGNFSPTLKHGIGLALVSPPPSAGDPITVMIRGVAIPAERATLPFVDK
jgi:aminomethyltransferase